MPPSDAHAICERVTASLPRVRAGTPRFWGQWFGRPMDSMYWIVRCAADAGTLRMWFDGDQALTVDAPVGFEVSAEEFYIHDANRVRWEWFKHGRARTLENLYFQEFVRGPEGITATTNVDWNEPNLQLSAREKAVEVR